MLSPYQAGANRELLFLRSLKDLRCPWTGNVDLEYSQPIKSGAVVAVVKYKYIHSIKNNSPLLLVDPALYLAKSYLLSEQFFLPASEMRMIHTNVLSQELRSGRTFSLKLL